MKSSLETVPTLHIATPEGVVFSMPLAGPAPRALAFLVDLLVLMAINSALNFTNGRVSDLGTAAHLLFGFVLASGYGAVSELVFNGQTVGKKVLGLRVLDERGLHLRPGQVLLRNLLRVVDILPLFYAVGGLACLCSRRCQRLGDLAAGTVVVRILTPSEPDVQKVLTGRYNSFREHPRLEARLRQKLSPLEAQLALSALLRRENMDTDAAVLLFALMAARFRELVKFPQEIEFGLSDEQYVRNVVDSIYRKAR